MKKDTAKSPYDLLCTRRHPEYECKHHHWEFLNSTYESERDWFRCNIFRFLREGDETYKGRLERAYRFNHTREVVDLVNKYLFKVEPQRSEEVPDYIKRFRAKTTMSGLSIAGFERQVSRMSSIYGRVHVVLDNNAKPDGVVSVADEKAGDAKLYAYIVKPQDFLDCGYDEEGHYTWVLLREIVRDDADPIFSSGQCVEKFRLWTKKEWFLIETRQLANGKKTYTLADKGTHNLDVVPVIKADHIESDNRYSVPALIEDIAYLDRAVANYLSNLDQIINDQTFSQLTMPAQSVLGAGYSSTATVDDSDSDPDAITTRRKLLKLGTSQLLLYDGEGGNAPEYISPDPRQATLIISTVKQIINEIYHTVGLAGERTKQDNSLGIDNSSGVAKAYDFERVAALLGAKANAMQNFTQRLENLARIWNSDMPLDDLENRAALYSTDFDVRSLTDDLTIASQLSLVGIPIEIRRKQLEGLVDKLWPLMAEKEKKSILQAIAKWNDQLYASPVPAVPPAKGKSVVTNPSVVEKAGKATKN